MKRPARRPYYRPAPIDLTDRAVDEAAKKVNANRLAQIDTIPYAWGWADGYQACLREKNK